MDSKILHNLKATPFNERESFNNAILLLSMVKSEYYYIVGFSRPDNQIEIGFDFEDPTYGKFSETITMDFSSDATGIKVTTKISNIVFKNETTLPFPHKNFFHINNCCVNYNRLFEKDEVIPVSMDKLNSIILTIKDDIDEFINQSIEYLLKNQRKNNENS